MAVIQITSTFSSDPRLTATPAPFDFFRKIPAYFFSMDSFAPATSEGFSATGSFSAFGAPPLAVSFTGTAFTYIDYSGNFDPALGFRGLPASGDVTGFIVSETTQSFPNGPAGPSSA